MRIVLVAFECGHHGWRAPNWASVYNGTTAYGRLRECHRCAYSGSEHTNSIWLIEELTKRKAWTR